MVFSTILKRLRSRIYPVRRRCKARSRWEKSVQELQSAFCQMACEQDRARGICWSSLEWTDEVVFARDRQSGLITAMAGFTVAFAATGLLEDEENAELEREATAIFHFQHGHWGSGGKMLLNMDPQLALARFGDQFESLEE